MSVHNMCAYRHSHIYQYLGRNGSYHWELRKGNVCSHMAETSNVYSHYFRRKFAIHGHIYLHPLCSLHQFISLQLFLKILFYASWFVHINIKMSKYGSNYKHIILCITYFASYSMNHKTCISVISYLAFHPAIVETMTYLINCRSKSPNPPKLKHVLLLFNTSL